jgi:hypothetical protein
VFEYAGHTTNIKRLDTLNFLNANVKNVISTLHCFKV